MAGHTGTSYADVLSKPPFYTISGVNSSAPIPQQMEQIDQLNTLLLQEIDANFARLHQIVTSRILPEIKRFAIANQPTRESASFWTQFFVSAYGVPPSDPEEGHSTFAHSPQHTEYEDHTLALRHDTFDASRGDGTFMFDPEPGKTSTPLPPRGKRTMPDSSLEASIESPFDKVDRQLSGLSMDVSDDASTPSLPGGYSGLAFGRGSPSEELPEFDGTMRYEPRHSAGTPRPAAHGASRSVFSQSPAMDSPVNPRLIDLTATPLNMNFHPLAPTSIVPSMRGAPSNRSTKTSGQSKPTARNLFDDDEDIKLGMSPPVTMKFSLPPTAQSIVTAGTTPMKPSPGKGSNGDGGAKEAKALDDLLGDMLDYQPSPRMPTPEGLRRYSVLPSDLSAARRLFDDMPPPPRDPPREAWRDSGPSNTTSAEPSKPASSEQSKYEDVEYDDDVPTRQYGGRSMRRSLANTSAGSDIQIQRDVTGRIITDDESFDDADDTLSSEGDVTAQPEAGFEFVDDSYISETSGYPLHGDVTDIGAVERTETGETSLFGRPAAAGQSKQLFSLHQQDEMVTYHGGRLEDAAGPESPTRQR